MSMQQSDGIKCARCGAWNVAGANDGASGNCMLCGSPLSATDAPSGALELDRRPQVLHCPLPRCGRAVAIRETDRGGLITCPGCATPYRVVDEHPPRLRPIARPVE
jgi:DNA-directed RNA polymerase subunit RPC12/RpoP